MVISIIKAVGKGRVPAHGGEKVPVYWSLVLDGVEIARAVTRHSPPRFGGKFDPMPPEELLSLRRGIRKALS